MPESAPVHPLPARRLTTLELPYTLSTSTSSHDAAVASLGGTARLSTQLDKCDANDPVEMQLKPADYFAHPVQGDFVKTANLLVKVKKRRRVDGTGERQFMVEPVGVVDCTVRFRSMADFQYAADPDQPVVKLGKALRSFDVETIKNFNFAPETEDYDSGLRLLPPPIFSRTPMPQTYGFKANAGTTTTTFTRPDGTVGERLINKGRYSGTPPRETTFDVEGVPQGPLPEVLKHKKPVDEPAFKRATELLQQRPVWTRQGLLNEMGPELAKVDHTNKHFWAMITYRFIDGPFRELLIRFGYDPRTDPEGRFYQRLSIRNTENKARGMLFTSSRAHVGFDNKKQTDDENAAMSHIFDGKKLGRQAGNFQLCDITEPLLSTLIHSDAGVLPFCGPRDGWYTVNAYNQFRAILRRKFHGLLENPPRVVGDVECQDLLGVDVSPDASELTQDRRTKTKAQERAERAASRRSESTPLEGWDGDAQMHDRVARRAPVASGSGTRQGGRANDEEDVGQDDAMDVDPPAETETTSPRSKRRRGR